MIKLNAISLDYEPRKKIVAKLKDDLKVEKILVNMKDTESAFICGLIEQVRPKKILEVGILVGGSTSVILQCLEDLGEPYEMHSVDLAKMIGTNKPGFLATLAKENNLFNPSKSTLHGKHTFHLGNYLPQFIDEIGGDIDFVILDTVHYTPGELLDFIVMLPYLKDDAFVVLHDVSLNQLVKENDRMHTPDAHATGLLFSAVVAKEKFLNSASRDKALPFSYPNIAAFKINGQTRLNIENVFLAMMLTWHYLPKDNEITIYRDFYNRHYPANLVEIFDECLRLNSNNVVFKKSEAPKKPEAPKKLEAPKKESLTYQTHVHAAGWLALVEENQISNNLNSRLDIQAIKINFPGHKVYYSVYYDKEKGWTKEVVSPEMAGAVGGRRSIYGVKICLDEASIKEFDILYRVHKFDDTWTPWAKNGEAIYSHGQQLNAIQIKLEPKTAQ